MVRVPTLRRVMSPQLPPNFHASLWQQGPERPSQWHALDTQFGNGQAFLETLLAWHADPQAPSQLFYTAFSEQAPDNLVPQLAPNCFGLLPGMHRICFANSLVKLNLCVGPIAANFKEIDIAADSIHIDNFLDTDPRSIARLSKLGTRIRWSAMNDESLAQLKASGFQLDTLGSSATYQPHWPVKTALRSSDIQFSESNRTAIVIGAGLAGAAVAYSLAQRGWQVEVIDQHTQTGGGASGLPAGIFATHVSPDNNVLSRITRDGVRATIDRAASLLKRGEEWDLSHLVEHRYSGKRELPPSPVWPESGLEWSSEANEVHKQMAGLNAETLALWHPTAGWIQTQALVKAQLGHPNISCRFETKVSQLIRQSSSWQLIDNNNLAVAQADHVIIANAHACQDLLNSVRTVHQHSANSRPQIPITPLRGQVTLGHMHSLNQVLREKLPTVPVNGHGSYMGNLPALQNSSEGPYWIVGSSFQRYEFDTTVREEDQQSNLKQWAELMPAWHDEILENVDVSKTQGWAGVRAALPDRLPAVGAFQHPDFEGLQVCTGMGARGISWSVLCGELLASKLNHEPLPMAATLAKLMAAARFG